jgi:molybdopterin/thiamine biosynthesis adenylyltransferase
LIAGLGNFELTALPFYVGQLKLRNAKILIVGAGGLGCPAALYLAGAGVGTIGLVDGDTVEASNFHRQVLHRSQNVGKLKVDSAIEYLREWVPTLELKLFNILMRCWLSID